jgi:hypothetical protein
MKTLRPDEFHRFDRMSIYFLHHVSSIFSLLKNQVCLAEYKSDYVQGDSGVHGQGIAIHFRIKGGGKIFSQTIKVVNCCNEYFKNKMGMKYRLGVYPNFRKPFFHLDIIQESLFWVGRLNEENNKIEYKFSKSMIIFLNDLDFLEGL